MDFVLPVADMPQRLLDLWSNGQRIWLPAMAESGEKLPPSRSGADAQRAEQALQDLMALLRQRTGHDFRHYKRATVLRRIERRMQVREVPDLRAYCEHLRDHTEETGLLLQDMLISVTNFFRDRDAFEALEREAIAPLLAGRAADAPVRAWVAGCATGEEAYSVAILLREAAQRHCGGGMAPLQVFATDIDERAIAHGAHGLYPRYIATDVSPARLRAVLHARAGDRYRVAKAVREPVLFAAHNVLRDPPFSRLDLICCRNLLIYLDRDGAGQHACEMFHFALRPGGYLFLGTVRVGRRRGRAVHRWSTRRTASTRPTRARRAMRGATCRYRRSRAPTGATCP